MGMILGLDEAGYGALCGRMYIGAVLVPEDWKGPGGLADTKELEAEERSRLYGELQRYFDSEKKSSGSTRYAEASELDTYGVGSIRKDLFVQLIELVCTVCDQFDPPLPLNRIIVDGNLRFPSVCGRAVLSIPKADSVYPSVMAAAILAKVERDRYVRETLHPRFPQYKLNEHMGYGTPEHMRLIQTLGFSPEHRKSYQPMRGMIEKAEAEKRKTEITQMSLFPKRF
jgi:ribonuclease HII